MIKNAAKWVNFFQNQNEKWIGLDLSDYATKANLKNAKSIDTSTFAKDVDLTNLKSNDCLAKWSSVNLGTKWLWVRVVAVI